MLAVDLGADGSFRGGKLMPTKLTGKGTATKGGDAIARVRRLNASDLPGTGVEISDEGVLSAPAADASG